MSTDGTSATNFLSVLVTSKTVSSVPVDPTNKATGLLSPDYSGENRLYFYHRYGAGSSGCDVARGPFYVFGATRMDTVSPGQSAPSSPGFSCSGRNWAVEGAWVTGGYTN